MEQMIEPMEQMIEFGIREPEPTLYNIMFASVLIMNIAFAVDVYRLQEE